MNQPSDKAELRLLTVHAHPDDEASKGAATVAAYHQAGVGCTLVCCTGGEEGEILNPAMDRPEVAEHLAEVRVAELRRAAEIIGYDEEVMLGYRAGGDTMQPGDAGIGSAFASAWNASYERRPGADGKLFGAEDGALRQMRRRRVPGR